MSPDAAGASLDAGCAAATPHHANVRTDALIHNAYFIVPIPCLTCPAHFGACLKIELPSAVMSILILSIAKILHACVASGDLRNQKDRRASVP